MKILTKIVIILLVILVNSKNGHAQSCKEVIGYYPGWQWYDRNKLVNPATIQYSKYTIINYAFFNPQADGSIQITDPWADKNLLLGTINWGAAPPGYDTQYDFGNPAYHNPGTSLIYHAHQANIQVLISVGGWTLSNNFPSIAADQQKRTQFAHSCGEMIRIYDIDGIDIDWEYPGFTDHMGTPNDIVNYPLLLQEVRDTLDVLEVALGKPLYLTGAFGAAEERMDDVDWDAIVPLMDFINLMSYDFFGTWGPESNHNAPLFAPLNGNPTFNCDHAVQKLINDYNVPPAKLTMGVAFYGRSVKTISVPDLHAPTTGSSDQVTFSTDDGTPLYYNVLLNEPLFDKHWDATAEVPYMTGKNGLQTFLSYDDEQSVGLKGQYIVNNELGGAIIWEITGDYIESSPGSGVISATPLIDTLNLALCNPPNNSGSSGGGSGDHTNFQENDIAIHVYPNPVQDQLEMQIPQGTIVDHWFISNSLGQIVLSGESGSQTIDVSLLHPGSYILFINTNYSTQQVNIIKG